MFSRTYLLIAEERWSLRQNSPFGESWAEFKSLFFPSRYNKKGFFGLNVYFVKTLRPAANELPHAGV